MGFTLIELLVVISIIGLVATIAFYSVNLTREKAKIAKAKADLKQIAIAIDILANDTGLHPGKLSLSPCVQDPEMYLDTCNAGLVCDSGFPNWQGPYMASVPLDPWGNKYIFDGDYGSARAIHSGGPNRSGINVYDTDNVVYVLCGTCGSAYGCD
ncbi:MAG: type II secretion system protein GspG [Patescibacteria group bacterium]|nr:type II secretion system protein GspG [Patescibacteria group bacterium]